MQIADQPYGRVKLRQNWHIEPLKDGFCLKFMGRNILTHSLNSPSVVIAVGNPNILMERGNFKIDDTPAKHLEPRDWTIEGESVLLSSDGEPCVRLLAQGDRLTVEVLNADFDRVWLKLVAAKGEAVWGGGEQISYLALNGRHFPMWTSEPGVGRDKDTALTQLMDREAMAGGDYWTTNYPQPSFLTSRWFAAHLRAECYSVLDFTSPDYHRLEVWSARFHIEFDVAENPAELVSAVSSRFGRQPPLPDWAINGAIVGLKDGARSFERLERFLDFGTAVSGLWCEDWAGVRETSFGRRLFWDWHYSTQRYPDLPDRIADLAARGIHFLAYANPYLAVDGSLYAAAQNADLLCLCQDCDEPYLVDFGEFDCGVLDFTNPAAREWFAEYILGRNMLDLGISGWMADFGEYLPTDLRLADGSDPLEAHNRWPVLWAQVNAEAIAARGKTGDAVFFMRAGFTGVQKYCPLLWAGDQSVDFTRHDGIGTVITAALSAGLLGNAYSHSDCGGYTSLHGNIRSIELMRRWCELAAFAPVMRSHEGNRPDDNLQYDTSEELLSCFALWSRIHSRLAPYTRALCEEAEATGLPAQRPLFLHYPNDFSLWTVQDQYLYGEHLLVAPVIEEGATSRQVILPGSGTWRHCWSGTDYPAGIHDVAAPLDWPPVFYRADGPFADLFAGLAEELNK